MKIEAFETFVVGNPTPGFGGRYFIFVRLHTGCGVAGVGEIYSATFGPTVICEMARDVFERYLAGRSPSHVERFWHRAHGSGFTHRPDSTMQAVISGLEMACWGISGKAFNQPVYELLGGKVNEKLRSYTYLYPSAEQDPGAFYNDAYAKWWFEIGSKWADIWTTMEE